MAPQNVTRYERGVALTEVVITKLNSVCVCVCVCVRVVYIYIYIYIYKTIPLQAWSGPDGSRSLRLPDFKKIGT